MANAEIARIANLLNKEILHGSYSLKELHHFRGKRTRKVFTKHGLKENYAFHAGGRQQTQFNFGFETVDGKPHFRYGIAFSLGISPSQLAPLGTFRPRIARYNDLVREAPERVHGLSMWCYDADHMRSDQLPAGPIPDDWVAPNGFIFIGLRHERQPDEVGSEDVLRAARLFDELFALFKDIERAFSRMGNEGASEEAERIARVCWNKSNWFRPSGRDGKAQSRDSFEGLNGFGLEEWLLNPRFEIDGYRYGYLQPVTAQIQSHEGHTYNVDLYAIRDTGKNREFYRVGRIVNVEVLSQSQRNQVLEVYREKGWLEEMKEDLRELGLDASILEKEAKLSGIANVRFKLQDVEATAPYLEPLDSKALARSSRHIFLVKRSNAPMAHSFRNSARPPLTLSGNTALPDEAVVRHMRKVGPVQCSRTHVEIQNALAKYLQETYPKDKVDLESKTALLTQVDCTRTGINDIRHYYEVKAYPAARSAIRDALGQLLEYAHYPAEEMARTLTIVAPARLSDDDRAYLKHLRERYGLPLAYLYFVSPQRGFIEELSAAE